MAALRKMTNESNGSFCKRGRNEPRHILATSCPFRGNTFDIRTPSPKKSDAIDGVSAATTGHNLAAPTLSPQLPRNPFSVPKGPYVTALTKQQAKPASTSPARLRDSFSTPPELCGSSPKRQQVDSTRTMSHSPPNQSSNLRPLTTTLPATSPLLPKKPPVSPYGVVPSLASRFTPPDFNWTPHVTKASRGVTSFTPPIKQSLAKDTKASQTSGKTFDGRDTGLVSSNQTVGESTYDQPNTSRSNEAEDINDPKAPAKKFIMTDTHTTYDEYSCGSCSMDESTDESGDESMEVARQKTMVRFSVDSRIDRELQVINAKLLSGVTELSNQEQCVLYMEIYRRDQRIRGLLDLVKDRVTNRCGNLTAQLAWCYRTWGNNEATLKLVRARITPLPRDYEEDLIDIDEVDKLMECQFVLEKLEAEMGHRTSG